MDRSLTLNASPATLEAARTSDAPTVRPDGSAGDPREFAGCRQLRRAASTGTVVGIYRTMEAGMGDENEGAWTLSCENHGRLLSTDTWRQAKLFAPVPEEWCEVCAGTDEEDRW